MKFFTRFLMFYALFSLLLFAAGCTTTWISTATGILQALIPAISALLATLGTIGVPAAVLTAFTTWSTKATQALTAVQALVASYNTAEASAQPGILGEIDSALTATIDDFESILSTVNVTDSKTQALWTQLATDFSAEAKALLNLIPVAQGEVTEHDEVVKRLNALKSAKNFRKQFNSDLKAGGWQSHAI
jgi:hypothetical protein